MVLLYDKFEVYLEDILMQLAKAGRHVRLVLFTNRTGEVRDSYGKILFKFASVKELYAKLYRGDY